MSTIIKFSLKELKKIISNENSCVSKETVIQNIELQPWCLSNVKSSIENILDYKIGKFDKDLDGIVLSYKNVRILDDLCAIRQDSAEIRSDVQMDLYLFRPKVGATLQGVVNKKSVTHVGLLVHRVFNVVLPRPTEQPGAWVGAMLALGQEVLFRIVVMDLFGALPYIRGCLDEQFLPPDVDMLDGDQSYSEDLSVTHVNFDGTKPLPLKEKTKKAVVAAEVNNGIYHTSREGQGDASWSSTNLKSLKLKNKKVFHLEQKGSPHSDTDHISDVDDTTLETQERLVKEAMNLDKRRAEVKVQDLPAKHPSANKAPDSGLKTFNNLNIIQNPRKTSNKNHKLLLGLVSSTPKHQATVIPDTITKQSDLKVLSAIKKPRNNEDKLKSIKTKTKLNHEDTYSKAKLQFSMNTQSSSSDTSTESDDNTLSFQNSLIEKITHSKASNNVSPIQSGKKSIASPNEILNESSIKDRANNGNPTTTECRQMFRLSPRLSSSPKRHHTKKKKYTLDSCNLKNNRVSKIKSNDSVIKCRSSNELSLSETSETSTISRKSNKRKRRATSHSENSLLHNTAILDESPKRKKIKVTNSVDSSNVKAKPAAIISSSDSEHAQRIIKNVPESPLVSDCGKSNLVTLTVEDCKKQSADQIAEYILNDPELFRKMELLIKDRNIHNKNSKKQIQKNHR